MTYADAVFWAKHHPAPICLVTGVFDILTAGHVSLIAYADTLGVVAVGLNTDSAVRTLKGTGRPINNENDRLKVMAALRYVTAAFLIDSTTVSEAIKDLSPAYWVKGSDYSMDTLNPLEREAAKKAGTIIAFAPHSGHSSSKVIQQAQSLKY